MIHIKEPFYTAGKMYNWGYKPIGLGIDVRELRDDSILEVRVGDSPTIYRVNKQKAREVITRFNSFFQAKSVSLGVIPWEIFESDKKSSRKEVKKVVKVGPQASLF